MLATLIPKTSQMRIALLMVVALILISLWLAARCLRLQKANLELTAASRPRRNVQEPKKLSPEAFAILCWIFDEPGEVTDERIKEKLKITDAEVQLHVTRLWELCYIRWPGDSLDDPSGYSINADGTEYVLKNR